MTNGTPPPPPGAPAAKKGLSVWAWLGIGCGAIVLVAVIAFVGLGFFAVKKGKEMVQEATGSESISDFVEDLQENPAQAAAELAVRVNPDLDLLSTDEDAGTITFRNNRTGEEATLNFEDIAEGKFSMTTDEGEFRMEASQAGDGAVTFTGPEGETRFGGDADLSDVPDWVPLYPGASDTKSTYQSSGGRGASGAITQKTSDSAQDVVDHYESAFNDAGYQIGSRSVTTTGDGAFGAISGDLGDGRSVNVVAMESAGETGVTINYNQKQ